MPELIETAKFSKSSHAALTHNHLSCELIFIKNGEAEFTFSDRVVTVGAGTVILITSLENHSVIIKKEPYERYYMILSPNSLLKSRVDPNLTSIFSKRTNHGLFVFDFFNEKEKILNLFEQIVKERNENDIYNEDMLKFLFAQLLILLYRNNPNNFERVKEIDRKMFQVQRYIEENFNDTITIEEISQKFYMSQSYLTHSFKESCGYSPQQYLILIRLLNAQRLLSSTDSPINEISSAVGFSDVNNFIRTFKKALGMTPKAFRNNGNI